MPSVYIPTHTHSAWGVGENQRTVVLEYVTPEELDDANARNSKLREDMNSYFREVRQDVRKDSEAWQRQIAELENRLAESDAKLTSLKQDISAMLQEETGKWIAKIGDELKPCYQAVQRQEELSQESRNLLKEFQLALAELRKKDGDIDRQLAELRTASDKGDDAESNEEWRKKPEEKLDSLEAAVQRLQGGTPCPPPEPKRGFRQRLCDLFRPRK